MPGIIRLNKLFILQLALSLLLVNCVNKENEAGVNNESIIEKPADNYLEIIDSLIIASYSYPLRVEEFTDSLESVLSRSGLLKDPEIKANLTFLRAMVAYVTGDYQNSIALARAASKDFLILGDSLSMYNAFSTIGAVNMYLAEYDSAQYYLLNAYQYFKNADLPEYIIKACINLSGTYYYVGEKGISLNYLYESLNEHRRYESSRTLSRTLLNTGLILEEFGRTEDARDTLTLALNESYKSNEVQVISDILNRLSLLETREGNYEKALGYYRELLDVSKSWSDDFIMSEALLHMSYLYDSINNPVKALETAANSYSKAEAIGARDHLARAAKRLSDLYSLKGDYRKSLAYLSEYTRLSGEIMDRARSEQILELETRYQTKQKEQEVNRLTLENELGKLKINQFRYLLILSIVLLLLIMLTALLLIRQRKIKNENELMNLEQKLFRLQINPHFIFNALNAIQAIVTEDGYSEARKLLSGFSRLMRLILESSEQDLIPLEDELEMIDKYLEIQQVRYPGMFEYSINLEENLETDIAVPPMILQPFAENSIIHGLRPLERKGHIAINVKLINDNLLIEISDDGIGRMNTGTREQEHRSMAMDITRRRFRNLQKKYRAYFAFDIGDLDPKQEKEPGTKVIFTLPDKLS